jgi:hypothetical protein
MASRVYIVPPALFAPVLLSLAAGYLAIHDSPWFLAALPFIWLGSICASPNLNLANGCLAYLAIIVGVILITVFRPLGIAILAGAATGLYASAIEKWMRMRPAPDGRSGAAGKQ